MKDSQQINFRNRLSNYYRYLVHKAEKDEPFEYIKVIHDAPQSSSLSHHAPSTSLPSVQDTQRSQNIAPDNKIHATIDSLHGKKTRRSHSPTKLRLPYIHSTSRDVTSPQSPLNTPSHSPSPSSDWQKYYNVHELSTIKLDQHTIELIEGNQRRAKAHPGQQRP